MGREEHVVEFSKALVDIGLVAIHGQTCAEQMTRIKGVIKRIFVQQAATRRVDKIAPAGRSPHSVFFMSGTLPPGTCSLSTWQCGSIS